MKTIKILYCMLICLIFTQITFSQKLDSVKIIPDIPSIRDSIYLATYSNGFSGDCTYIIGIDSIKGKNIYISGKYDSNNKCGISKGISDTICLGLFTSGTYLINYSLIDTHGVFKTSILTINFTVTESTGLNNAHIKKKINIYPNPCNTYLNISVLSDMSKKTFVQLFNSIGQLEFENYIQITNSELTIDMSKFKKGIYFLRIEDNETTDIKIIKE